MKGENGGRRWRANEEGERGERIRRAKVEGEGGGRMWGRTMRKSEKQG